MVRGRGSCGFAASPRGFTARDLMMTTMLRILSHTDIDKRLATHVEMLYPAACVSNARSMLKLATSGFLHNPLELYGRAHWYWRV